MLNRTLQTYMFFYMMKMTVFFLIAISLLILLIDVSELSNRLSNNKDYVASIGFQIAAMRLPFIVQVASPFLILGGTMATLMQLNKKNELVVARSVGVSAWQFLMPLWLFAFLAGVFSVIVVNPLASHAFSVASEYENQLLGRPPTSGPLAGRNPWLRQQAEDGGTMLIGAQRVSNRGLALLQPKFIRLNADGDLVERYDARIARLNENQWVLEDLVVSEPGKAGVLRKEMVIPTDLNPAVVTEALVPPEMVSFFDLGKQIDNARIFGVSTSAFEMRYHSLIALPALLVAMTLIGATVSLRFVRFGLSPTMVLGGIIAGFVLYVVTEVTGSFGSAGIISPIAAAWLPVVATGMFGVAFLLHREDG